MTKGWSRAGKGRPGWLAAATLGAGLTAGAVWASATGGAAGPATRDGDAEGVHGPLGVPGAAEEPGAPADPSYGLRIEQFVENPMAPDGVDPGVVAASRERRNEALARELPSMLQPGATLPPTPEERLARAAAAVPIERARLRRRAAEGFPALAPTGDPPDVRQCERFCDHLAGCNRAAGDEAFADACRATCGERGFGGPARIEQVLRLGSCRHL